MKRLIFTLLTIIAFASCEKERGQCWTCEYPIINGYKPDTETYCQEEQPTGSKVFNGVDYPMNCSR